MGMGQTCSCQITETHSAESSTYPLQREGKPICPLIRPGEKAVEDADRDELANDPADVDLAR